MRISISTQTCNQATQTTHRVGFWKCCLSLKLFFSSDDFSSIFFLIRWWCDFKIFKGNPQNGAKVDKINGFWRIFKDFQHFSIPFSNPPWHSPYTQWAGQKELVTCKEQLVPSTPLPYVRGADREELLAPSILLPSEKAKGWTSQRAFQVLLFCRIGIYVFT